MHRVIFTCRSASLALVSIFLVCLSSAAAVAQPTGSATPPVSTPEPAGPQLVIHPADGVDGDYFTLEAEPGSTHELSIVLGNADAVPRALRTYVNDAVPITNGGFSIADEETPATGTATWIDYPAETFEFEPGGGVERSFTVTVPEGTAPGQYIAGIALQTAEPLSVEGSAMFNQIIRKVVAVFIIVPGPESPAFSLGEPVVVAAARGNRIDIPVVNSGNVLVKPQGELTLTDASGAAVLTVPIAMGSVYAGTTAPLSISLPSSVPDGDYVMQLSLGDANTGATAMLEQQAVTLAATDQAASEVSIAGETTLLPDVADPAYAELSLTITNDGEPAPSAAVVLDVLRDGELVESFPLVSSLSLPQGSTEITQRYIPPTGFEPGEWSFVVHVDIIDPATGAATTVATLDTMPPIRVG